jgi:IS30 family transposase
MKQAGKKQIEIAQAIGFSQSVISKELSRNRGERGYRPHSGQVSHFNKITFLMLKPDLTILVNPISPIASLNSEELAGKSASTRYGI